MIMLEHDQLKLNASSPSQKLLSLSVQDHATGLSPSSLMVSEKLEGWIDNSPTSRNFIIQHFQQRNRRFSCRRTLKLENFEKTHLQREKKLRLKRHFPRIQNDGCSPTIESTSSQVSQFSKLEFHDVTLDAIKKDYVDGKRIEGLENIIKCRKSASEKKKIQQKYDFSLSLKKVQQKQIKEPKFRLRNCENVGLSNYPINTNIFIDEVEERLKSKLRIYLKTRYTSR